VVKPQKVTKGSEQMEYTNKTLKFPNTVVRICSPVLTEAERNARLKEICKAAAELLAEQKGNAK
jgi:hypothetical protein